mgnify:CR=1 FL=1
MRLADPFRLGWRLLPDDVSYVLSQHPSVLWTIKVACVVVGHIVAVVSAHDRALRLLPQQHPNTGQVAMMLTIVSYTWSLPSVRRLSTASRRFSQRPTALHSRLYCAERTVEAAVQLASKRGAETNLR